MSDISRKPLSELTVDFPTRPKMPPLPGATDEHRRQGQKLAAIHRGHLWEIARIDRALRRIEAGDAPPEELQQIVLASDMAQNFRAFGTICGQECKMLTFHHNAEEHGLFPEMEATGNAALVALIARLREEHEIVHELLIRLERASMALMFDASDSNFKDAAAIFRQLQSVVYSHFGYEETELEEAIGVYGPEF